MIQVVTLWRLESLVGADALAAYLDPYRLGEPGTPNLREGNEVKLEDRKRAVKTLKPLGAPFWCEQNKYYSAACKGCGVMLYGLWLKDGVREARAMPSGCFARVGGRKVDRRCEPPVDTSGIRCKACGPHAHLPPGWVGEDYESGGVREEPASLESLGEMPSAPTPAPAPRPIAQTPVNPTMELSEAISGVISDLRERVRSLESEVDQLTTYVTDNAVTQRLEVRIAGLEASNTIENPHVGLKDALSVVSMGFKNLYVAGPAGSGKTTLAVQLAKALGIPFRYLPMTGGVNETHYLGVSRPNLTTGEECYVESGFIRIYDKAYEGGVFLFDEVDGGDPNVVLGLNAPIDNGQVDNPYSRRVHYRHEKTIIIFSANTWGNGPTAQYVGRNALDAATLNRFTGAKLFIDYDKRLEATLASQNVCSLVWAWRQRCQDRGVQRVLSTRDIKAAGLMERAGCSTSAISDRILVDWTRDERAKVVS